MNKKQKKRLYKISAGFLLFAIALILRKTELFFAPITAVIFFIIAYIIVGKDTLLAAYRNIKGGDIFDENFLMGIATLGAFAIGEYPEAVAVILFYEVGELFQSIAVDKSRKSITELMDIRPDYANLQQADGSIERVDPYDVEIGDIIQIKPGEKVPIDGIVIKGEAFLDTSALTGESVPRKVGIGDEVLSGFIDTNAVLEVRTTKYFADSTASKILEMVEMASSRKSKQETFITKFARVYTPIVVFSAIAIALIPPLFTGFDFITWLYRALTFLVVSCPCALVISVPLSFFAGIGAASNIGILVKGSNYLEALANADIGVFDKTGTLTEGRFEVTDIVCANSGSKSKEEILEMAALAEYYSSHPIALSIKKAYGKDIEEARISDLEEISGHGIYLKVDSKTVLVGNAKLMDRYQVSMEEADVFGTVVYIAIDLEFAGYIVISDIIKEDAASALSGLKRLGLSKLIMLTGDHKKAASAVAKDIGLDEVYAELLPYEKVEMVEKALASKKADKTLFFVGDGINDAPVLARADIGIAMGGLGSDAAIEAADIVLMTDEPSKLIQAIKLARRTLRISQENIYFAIGIKIAVLILSALGLASMWAAIFADTGVAVIAILNSMRNMDTKKL